MDMQKVIRDPWVWGQLVLLGAALLLPPWLAARANTAGPALLGPDPPPARAAGLALLGIGVAIMLAGARALGRNLTPATTPVANGRLIEHGIYSRARHPIYSGLVVAIAGAPWGGSNWLLGLVAGAAEGIYFNRKAATEERKLLARYPQYAEYAARVPRLVPRLPR